MAEENAALALQTHLLARSSRRQVVAEELRRELGLPDAPHRIEGFDISNIQGQEAVGSMVVWEAGGMKKDDYKRFKIRTVPGADDFAMMAEVLRRRYGKALEEGGTLPDLILLDGGRGQLSAGSRVLEELGLDYLPIVALAKRAEEVYHPGEPPPARPRPRVAGAPDAPADPGRGAPLRDHLPQEAPPEAHPRLRARPDPRRGPVDPDEPPEVARLGAPRADRLRRGARRGAEGHPEARAAHPRLLPPGGRRRPDPGRRAPAPPRAGRGPSLASRRGSLLNMHGH